MFRQWRSGRLAGAAIFLPVVLYAAWAAWHFARFGYPDPVVHDEFSYLLAAGTFARGRLANPSPRFPEFFETIHVLVEPAYASMYPPAQGLWLAAGQAWLGHPWWGVVISSALFVAATGWAALPWIGSRWALGAGTLALRYVVGTAWSTSYWGGSVAALGGAIVLGAVGRLRHRWLAPAARQEPGGGTPPWGLAALWSLGCVQAVLARPYEGGVLALLSAMELVRLLARSPFSREQKRKQWIACAASAALPACAGLLFLLAVNQASTGSPWRLAYQEHARQYQIRRTFFWQKDRPAPPYRHESIRAVYEGLLRRDMPPLERIRTNFATYRDHYGSLKLNVAGLAAAAAWGAGAGLAWVLWVVFAGLAAVWSIVWTMPHYYAPFAAFLAVAVAGGAGAAAQRKWFGRSRPGLVALLFVGLLAPGFGPALKREPLRVPFLSRRTEIITRLEKDPERHLILVRYRPGRNWYEEWVYNDADLENAKILWARWHESPRLPEFLSRHRDRVVWLLEADLPGYPLERYPPPDRSRP